MGSQQMLLLIIGVLMVGLMISVGTIMFADSSAASNRDAVANDLAAYASKAQAYQKKPKCLGGGGNSFVGFALMPSAVSNLNGTFSVSGATGTQVVIEGVGVEPGFDKTHPVKVAVQVRADSILVSELN
jgi:hypothetical protein